MNGKQLKNSILQWAIQGKLVPQNPKDEPASKLLERIAAQRIVASGAKQSKKNPASRIYRDGSSWFEQVGSAQPKDITEEIPFDIPESWEWCRLKDYLDVRDGTHDSPKYYPSGIPFVTSKNLVNGKIDFSDVKYISEEDHLNFSTRSKVENNDILFAMIGSIGNPVLVKKDREFSVKNVALFKAYTIETDMQYMLMYFQYVQQELKKIAAGGVQSFVSLSVLRNWLFPLPPLAEQKRIVKKLEQILPLVDEYDQAQTQLDKLNKELPEALKKSILQQAIQGKLVPQNPKDEPADKLLERITISRHSEHSEEYSKKSRKSSSKYPVSRIYRDTDGLWYEQIGTSVPKDITEEIPFEIPETWTWCRLNYVCDIARGGSPRPIQEYLTDAPDGLNWIKIGDTEKGGKYINSTKEKIKPEGLKKTRMIHKGDFLLTNSMSFGRPYISNIDGCIHDGWLVISMLGESFYPDYLYYLLSSQYAYNQFCGKVAGAVVKNLNSDKVAESIIPLPPLAEQKRIVAKLEQLFKAL